MPQPETWHNALVNGPSMQGGHPSFLPYLARSACHRDHRSSAALSTSDPCAPAPPRCSKGSRWPQESAFQTSSQGMLVPEPYFEEQGSKIMALFAPSPPPKMTLSPSCPLRFSSNVTPNSLVFLLSMGRNLLPCQFFCASYNINALSFMA